MNKDKIWISAKCNDYYKLIKKIEFIKVLVYEVKYENKIIYLKIDVNDWEKIDKYLVSYRFKIVSFTGLKKVIDTFKREKIYVIALIIGLMLLFVCKNLIVEVNVIHENKEIREIIADELKEYGIKILRFKKSYKELNKIREKILDKYPDRLDWMEFDVNGMVVNVRVEERIITDTSKDDKVCDLVATKDGVVNDIVVLDGEAKVMINDYVRKGDLLVSGTIKHNEEAKRYTCARGEVYATTWYTAQVSMPFEYEELEKTGKKKYNLVWENDGNKKEILRSRFENYESELKNIFHIFDFYLYLDKEYEVRKTVKKYSEEEVLEAGINKALDSIKKKLGKNDEIIDKKVLKKVKNDSTMDIDVFIIVKELISTEKEIKDFEGTE